ncbi:efflux RND transporter permease subunit [Rhizobium sp. BK399]|uniref:efflux RND transporter permease subunit n=1 Tax=Rhizobium sp. BK399 TaxID=2587063 RepID=UPI001802B9C2|nr:efflux RND transporter permease subunit [Rhizobium sp. BK399]MBB3542240.1 HAE1 family hydrophobic/amphiphilic exporter-1 [Rhizobium sp. BK399]
MSFNLSRWSIERPAYSIAIFVLLVVMGLLSLHALPINRFPEMESPIVKVVLRQQAASASDLEYDVAQKSEDALLRLQGIRRLDTTIEDGAVTFNVEFDSGIDPQLALERTDRAIRSIRGDLPAAVEEPAIEISNLREIAIATFAVQSNTMSLQALNRLLSDDVLRRFERIRGVGKVVLRGGDDREVRVWLDPDEMLARGLSAGAVSAALRTAITNSPAGIASTNDIDRPIRTVSAPSAVAALANVVLPDANGSILRLSDIARIEDGWAEANGFAQLNGEPILALSFFTEKGANEVETFTRIRAAIDNFAAEDTRLQFTLLDENASYTRNNVASTVSAMIEGAVCTIAVLFLFLRDWRSVTIAAISLPLAVIPTFFVMEALGFSLNLVSLLGLTLAIGLLVDDTIVEIENTARHLEMGKTPFQAVIDATDEIGSSVIAISLTIVAVFAPLAMIGGMPGQYFREFGMTVAAATVASLLVARLMTPLLASRMLRPRAPALRNSALPASGYSRLLRFATGRHRIPLGRSRAGLPRRAMTLDMSFITIALGIASLAWTAFFVLPGLTRGFIPEEDGTQLRFTVEMAGGTSNASMREKSGEVTRLLAADENVMHVYAYRSAPAGRVATRQAFSIQIELTDPADRAQTRQVIASNIARKLTSVADIGVNQLGLTGGRQFSVSLLSEDAAALERASDWLASSMATIPSVGHVSSFGAAHRPELQIIPDLDLAASLGVDLHSLSNAVRVATMGDRDRELGSIQIDGRSVPVRVEAAKSANELSVVETIPLRTGDGKVVPLGAVARIATAYGPGQILRQDGLRRIELNADLAAGASPGTALALVKSLIEQHPLPAGVILQTAGETRSMEDFFASFVDASILGSTCVFVILFVLFGSPFQPLTILLSLPLALSGGLIALAATGHGVTMPVLIGALMLMGIVAKNAILIVDLASRIIEAGEEPREAVVLAAERRFRPIVMTTVAMVAGMMPVAFGTGDGGAFRAPMAIFVIGGLVASTALSLVFVPALYLQVQKIGAMITRIWSPKPSLRPQTRMVQSLDARRD